MVHSDYETFSSCGCHSAPAPGGGPLLTRYMNSRGCAHRAYEPTLGEHVANTLSHAVALPASALAVGLMLRSCDTVRQTICTCVYGTATLMLFSLSTTYHAVELTFRPRYRQLRFWLHIGDRAGIYLYIAASYTPWLLLRNYSPPAVATVCHSLAWLGAAAGIAYQYCFHERFKRIETLLYIVVGGLPALAVPFMVNRAGLLWNALAALSYVVGIGFFKADGRLPFAHAIWHAHVVCGALFQFIPIYGHLLGTAARSAAPAHVEL